MIKNAVYLGVLGFIIAAVVALPFVEIPISTSSRGIIRNMTENTKLTAIVSRWVIKSNLYKNNQLIDKDDTLLVIITDQLKALKISLALRGGENKDIFKLKSRNLSLYDEPYGLV